MSIPSFRTELHTPCYHLFITHLLQCSWLLDTTVWLNLALDVIFFFNILLLGDLISLVWRCDRRDVAVAQSKNGPPPSAPVSTRGEILQSDYLRYFWLHLSRWLRAESFHVQEQFCPIQTRGYVSPTVGARLRLQPAQKHLPISMKRRRFVHVCSMQMSLLECR